MDPSCVGVHDAAGNPCAAQNPPNICVDITTVVVPQYYIGAIPAERKPIYNVLGIRYVCVHGPAVGGVPTNYYILESSLADVVRQLKLYN